MRLGLLTRVFYDRSFERALDKIVEFGLDTIEIPAGNYVGEKHCDPAVLLKEPKRLAKFERAIRDRNLMISALAVHGNPLHPSKELGRAHVQAQRNAIILAEKLGVERITLLSGCPGDSEAAKYPNWVSFGVLDECRRLLDWQWREKVIPIWQTEADFAEKHGVSKICIEMHVGMVVYNPQTLLKLRKNVGKVIGANFDPSHLFWQGIDPVVALKTLKDVVYHFHAKDTYVAEDMVRLNGVLPDSSDYALPKIPWYYRTVGYGHSGLTWRNILSTLRLIGYDYTVSIEHEDELMSLEEGAKRAVEFLRSIMLTEPPSEPGWWEEEKEERKAGD